MNEQTIESIDTRITSPAPCDAERFDYALNCLPPLRWGTWCGVESFRMSEFVSDDITTFFARTPDGRCWTFNDKFKISGDAVALKVLEACRATPELDPAIPVRLPGSGGAWGTWRITQNMTDRWGELNNYKADEKHLDQLQSNPELLAKLVSQLTDEVTFVVRKDGQYGLLFEVEYCSVESETGISDDLVWLSTLRPRAEVAERLLKGIEGLAPLYPGVSFCIPREEEIIEERCAVWAFSPDGHLSPEKASALADALARL